MASEGIPDEVKRFITRHVTTVEQVEVLLLLHGTPREWNARAVAQQLAISQDAAERQLAALAADGILATIDAGERSYRYQPRASEMSRMVDGLARAYAERRVAVITAIYSKPSDHLRSFSDAFRLRQEDQDG